MNKIISNQKILTNIILKDAKNYLDPQSLCCGGAPRSWYFNQPANDIDIYIRDLFEHSTDRNDKVNKIINNLNNNGYEIIKINSNSENYFGSINIVFIYDLEIKKSELHVQVQLVFVKPKNNYILLRDFILSRFDVGICKFSYEMKNDIIEETTNYYINIDDLAKKDIKNKTITLYCNKINDQQLIHSIRFHIPKLQKYFPDYKLIIQQ